jgi:iron(III) transport system ATP-binding protein
MQSSLHTTHTKTGEPGSHIGVYRPASSILELRSVSCAYDTSRPAIKDISFSIREGEILCLLGPSGCGKTTVLRAIAGFEPVRSGQIFLSDRLVSSSTETVPTEERRVGMVFQEYALFPHLRAADNIAFGLHHLSRAERTCRVQEMLRLTGLEGLEHRYPHELSGGQQQRVALSRALVQNPVLLLLDEPFSNLDPDMASRMRQDLHSLLRRTKTTTILVTHDHDEAFAMADRIARQLSSWLTSSVKPTLSGARFDRASCTRNWESFPIPSTVLRDHMSW